MSSPGAQRSFPEVPGRKSRKIGLFGGTFDPPHVGHLVTAVNVRHALDLDVVVLMVANVPWQKQGSRAITPADDRFAMVQAAVAEVAGLEAGDLEIRRGGASYTADTLAALAEEYPDADLYTVVGDDAAAGITTWERYDEVAARSTLVVVDRPGAPVELPEQFPWARVEVPRLEVSSTDLRARVSDGRPLDYLVTEPVLQIIRDRRLYRSADGVPGAGTAGTATAVGTSDVSGAVPVPGSPAPRGPESLEEVR